MKAEYPDHLDYWGLGYAFDRDRTGDLGIMRPTRCQLRHESVDDNSVYMWYWAIFLIGVGIRISSKFLTKEAMAQR